MISCQVPNAIKLSELKRIFRQANQSDHADGAFSGRDCHIWLLDYALTHSWVSVSHSFCHGVGEYVHTKQRLKVKRCIISHCDSLICHLLPLIGSLSVTKCFSGSLSLACYHLLTVCVTESSVVSVERLGACSAWLSLSVPTQCLRIQLLDYVSLHSHNRTLTYTHYHLYLLR